MTILNKFTNSQLGIKVRQFSDELILDIGDYRKTVILAGTGRSGTTWVEEIINSRNNFRIMFEPFHAKKIDIINNWKYRQYLRKYDYSDHFLKPAYTILNGNIRNKWVDRFNKTIFPQKRLIKDIRIQLILGWIKHHFPEIPIILLIRHPFAVATSKLKLNWETHLDEFLVQPQLMEDFLNPFKEEINRAKSPFERHIFMWCIENYIPIKQFSESEILVVFYEKIYNNPQIEIERITSFIGETYSPEMLDNVAKPSALTRKDSALVSDKHVLNEWKKYLSEYQIEKGLEILNIFGLDKIYNSSELPLLSETEVLKSF